MSNLFSGRSLDSLRVFVSVFAVLATFYFVHVRPYGAAEEASLLAKNEFIAELNKQSMQERGRRISRGEPEMELIYNFRDQEAEIRASIESIEGSRFFVAIFLFSVFSLGVCRLWAAGFVALMILFPLLSPKINYFALFWPYALSLALGGAVAYMVGRWKKLDLHGS